MEYQNTTIGGNISLARGKRLRDECANAAVDRRLIKPKILVIYCSRILEFTIYYIQENVVQ